MNPSSQYVGQSYPLAARTSGGKEWLVIGWWWSSTGEQVPMVVPRTYYALEAAATTVVGPDGSRQVVYVDPPAAPRVLDLRLIDGWFLPADEPGVS